jgi:hypothetical protein
MLFILLMVSWEGGQALGCMVGRRWTRIWLLGAVALAGSLCSFLMFQPRVSPIFKAVEGRNKAFLAQTLETHHDEINSLYFGRTPLHLTVINNCIDLASMILRAGADINAVDYYGNSPLHVAVFCHRENMMSMLLREGAQVNLRNGQGFTPLHVAVFVKTQVTLMKELLSKGADPDLPDNRGQSALQLARERFPDCLPHLLASPDLPVHPLVN